jgi:hypothetical protein
MHMRAHTRQTLAQMPHRRSPSPTRALSLCCCQTKAWKDACIDTPTLAPSLTNSVCPRVCATTEGARMLSMPEGDDVKDEQSPIIPPVAHEGTRQIFSKSQYH